jgi:WD40 repeat protein
LRCHKVINDFLFIDSSSILLTAGTSNDSYVVSLWDTLLPSNKCLIKSYREPDIPSAICACYSPLNHFAYSGNRKGEVSIYDVRMHKKIHKIVAHESAVKAIALDPDEYFLATGSSEGNVKIWNMKTFECVQVYHNEHTKSSLIRNFNSGVNQLYFTHDNQLISCGADGTLVIRNL